MRHIRKHMFSIDLLYRLLVASLVVLVWLVIGLIVHYRPLIDKELQSARDLMTEVKSALAVVKSVRNPVSSMETLFAPKKKQKKDNVLNDFLNLIPK